MAQPRKRRIRRILWPLLVTLTAFLIYLLTLAPTVLWGDDAYFQRTAYTEALRADGGGHWLWLQLARLFVRLPWGDVAFRSNLLSAVAGTATLIALYAAARQAGLRRDGATVSVVVIAVGHTFWMHAVRAEVYTVFTFFVALHLYLWARWCAKGQEQTKGPSAIAPIYAGAALFGITLLAHQMALLLAPAWAFLVWSQRRRFRLADAVRATVVFGLGLIPFLAVIHVQIATVAQVHVVEAMWLFFTHAGADFGPSLFDFSATMLPFDVLAWVMFTVLQFVGLAPGLIIWGLYDRLRAQEQPAFWLGLFLFYVTDVVFAISYRVNDRYVFLLPGYLVLALFAGAGWQAVSHGLENHEAPANWIRATTSIGRRKLYIACLVLLVAAPVSAYAIAPPAMAALDMNPLNVRSLPGREPNSFFLWPGKQGYLGARRYGEEAFAALPYEAILIADHTPVETLRFLQEVEGVRRDVRLIQIEPGEDLGPLLDALPHDAPIFLADNNPDYYDLDSVPQARLTATGPVFRLEVPAS